MRRTLAPTYAADDSSCRCNGKMDSTNRGQCTTEHDGALFCYVDPGTCADENPIFEGSHWSHEACESPSPSPTASALSSHTTHEPGDIESLHARRILCYSKTSPSDCAADAVDCVAGSCLAAEPVLAILPNPAMMEAVSRSASELTQRDLDAYRVLQGDSNSFGQSCSGLAAAGGCNLGWVLGAAVPIPFHCWCPATCAVSHETLAATCPCEADLLPAVTFLGLMQVRCPPELPDAHSLDV